MGTAKIIVSMDGEVLRELDLTQERISIGRRPYNDIVLDSPSISGEHAVITTARNESILEDLNSTNGTYVNSQPIKKHFLQNGDVIDLINYRIHYVDSAQPGAATQATDANQKSANLLVLNGNSSGKSMPLTKTATTLGRPGTQVAVITRRANGYAVAHVEGPAPLVNKQPVGATPHPLANGDIIELSGTQIKFTLP